MIWKVRNLPKTQVKNAELLIAISISLWSRNSVLVTCLRFNRQDFVTGLPSMVGSPTELLLPVPGNGKALSTAAVSMRRLEYETGSEVPSTSIYSLQLLSNDLSLHHGFICPSSDSVVEPPRHSVSSRAHIKSALVALDEDDDFVIPDELSQKKRIPRNMGKSQSHKITYRVDESSRKTKCTETNQTVDNQVISSKISGSSQHEQRHRVTDIVTALQDLILDEDVLGLGEPAKTLLEQSLNPIPEVGELSETSQVMANLLSLSRTGPVPDEPGVSVKRLQIPAWASPINITSGNLDFGGLYNHIVEHQLAPLVDEIPPRLRMAREKLACQLAAEVILASSRVEVIDPPEESQEQDEIQQSLPFHGNKGKGRLTDSFLVSSQLSDYVSSQNLPTPSPSASRAASTILSDKTASRPSVASQSIHPRLSRHVEFEPPATWAKRPMTLLAHWDVGQDPNTYSYTQKWGELEKQKQEESMTDKQRLKAREKAERRLRRQRREAEKARGALMSSQPMVMSSQAHRAGSQIGGSQYGGGTRFGGSQHGRSSPPLPSSPPLILDGGRERDFAISSQMIAPPIVGSSQAPKRRGDGPAKRKKRKREGF